MSKKDCRFYTKMKTLKLITIWVTTTSQYERGGFLISAKDITSLCWREILLRELSESIPCTFMCAVCYVGRADNHIRKLVSYLQIIKWNLWVALIKYWNAVCNLHQVFVTWGWICMILLTADEANPMQRILEFSFQALITGSPSQVPTLMI